MQKITFVLLALAAVALTDAPADAGSWCANYRRGVSNCGYNSFEQCWAPCWALQGTAPRTPFPERRMGPRLEAGTRPPRRGDTDATFNRSIVLRALRRPDVTCLA